MQAKPFGRALNMMRAIAAAMGLSMAEKHIALANLGEYKSRGHGRGVYSGKKQGNPGTDWKGRLNGQTNGKRECERRMRQAARRLAAA